MWKEIIVANFRYYLRIHPEELSKKLKHCQYSHPGRDSNWGLSMYKPEALRLEQTYWDCGTCSFQEVI
jgi:hypothetical protein